MEIYIINYRYDRDKEIIDGAGYADGEGNYYYIGKLPPLERQCNIIPKFQLDKEIEPNYVHIFEIRIIYSRASDLANFIEGSYYFLTLNGNWVNEKKISHMSEYHKMIDAVKQFSITIDTGSLSDITDILHPLTLRPRFAPTLD